MVDRETANSDNVVQLGRGGFFAVDCRCWAMACGIGINAAIAYLVLARGTGRDNRTTVWSAHAVENNTMIPWRMAEAQALVDAGLVRKDRGGSRPKYYLLCASLREVG